MIGYAMLTLAILGVEQALQVSAKGSANAKGFSQFYDVGNQVYQLVSGTEACTSTFLQPNTLASAFNGTLGSKTTVAIKDSSNNDVASLAAQYQYISFTDVYLTPKQALNPSTGTYLVQLVLKAQKKTVLGSPTMERDLDLVVTVNPSGNILSCTGGTLTLNPNVANLMIETPLGVVTPTPCPMGCATPTSNPTSSPSQANASTWVVPSNVQTIRVQAWGGGGGGAGGGSMSNGTSLFASGGGAGAYVSASFAVTPGSQLSYIVGSGGAGGGPGASGSPGGSTWIKDGQDTLLTAGGGTGGQGTSLTTGSPAQGGTPSVTSLAKYTAVDSNGNTILPFSQPGGSAGFPFQGNFSTRLSLTNVPTPGSQGGNSYGSVNGGRPGLDNPSLLPGTYGLAPGGGGGGGGYYIALDPNTGAQLGTCGVSGSLCPGNGNCVLSGPVCVNTTGLCTGTKLGTCYYPPSPVPAPEPTTTPTSTPSASPAPSPSTSPAHSPSPAPSPSTSSAPSPSPTPSFSPVPPAETTQDGCTGTSFTPYTPQPTFTNSLSCQAAEGTWTFDPNPPWNDTQFNCQSYGGIWYSGPFNTASTCSSWWPLYGTFTPTPPASGSGGNGGDGRLIISW